MLEATWKQFENKRIQENLTLGEMLGFGACGAVFKATNDIQDVQVNRLAVKIFLDQSLARRVYGNGEPQVVAVIDNEIQHAMRVNHPNLVRAFFAGSFTIDNRVFRYLAMEAAESDLRKRLNSVEDPLEPEECLVIAEQINRALNYLHSVQDQMGRTVHRDLKPQNVLLFRMPDGNKVWKLSDFGTARSLGEWSRVVTANLGTANYMPPEASYGANGITSPAWDVWSFGKILEEMTQLVADFDPVEKRLLEALVAGCLVEEPRGRMNTQQLTAGLRAWRVWRGLPDEDDGATPVRARAANGKRSTDRLTHNADEEQGPPYLRLFLMGAAFCIVLIVAMAILIKNQ